MGIFKIPSEIWNHFACGQIKTGHQSSALSSFLHFYTMKSNFLLWLWEYGWRKLSISGLVQNIPSFLYLQPFWKLYLYLFLFFSSSPDPLWDCGALQRRPPLWTLLRCIRRVAGIQRFSWNLSLFIGVRRRFVPSFPPFALSKLWMSPPTTGALLHLSYSSYHHRPLLSEYRRSRLPRKCSFPISASWRRLVPAH